MYPLTSMNPPSWIFHNILKAKSVLNKTVSGRMYFLTLFISDYMKVAGLGYDYTYRFTVLSLIGFATRSYISLYLNI